MCESRPIESLDIDDARALVIGADDDPASVRDMAAAALAHLGDGAVLDEAEAIAAWALGLALRHLRELDTARSWLDRALEALAPGSDDHTHVTLTLTGTMAYLGELAEAAQRLRDAEPSDALVGRVTFQLAAVTERLGRVEEAAAGYHDALAQFRRSGDRLGEAHALSGIGLVELESDRPAAARTTFQAALEIYRELDLEMLIATGKHNVGLAAMRSGDLVRASKLLGESARELDRLGQPFTETALDHVESLLLLGRPDEAAERATRALGAIQASSASTDRAEMLTALGLALARAGAHDVAERAFSTADRLFLHQDRAPWRSVVDLRRLQSEVAPDHSTLDSLLTLSTALRATGMETAAVDADAAAVDIADRIGAANAVDEALTRLLELDVDDPRRLHAQALRALAAGDLQSARRSTRSAVSTVTGRLAEPLTLDVKSSLLAQRDGVVRIGLETARRLDDPSMVVDFVLATQPASAFDPDAADRRRRNAGELVTIADDGVRLTLVRRLNDRDEFVDAPDRGAVVEALTHHAFLLSDAIVRPPRRDDAERLDRSAAMIRALAPWLESTSNAPLLLVVSGELARAPWTSVAARPVRLVTSMCAQDPPASRVTIASGPGLRSADDEVDALAALLGDRGIVASRADDPIGVVEGAGGAVLHLCCHGHHDPGNPMLSAYHLHAGDLTGHDIASVDTAPHTVVAAACRAGEARSFGRHVALGLPTAWVAAGASTVVAPVFPLPDDERTVRTMTSLHRSLLDGSTPEDAVTRAGSDGDPLVARCLTVSGRLPASPAFDAPPAD